MGASDQRVLSVQLTMTPELANELQREQGALEVAKAYVIDSPEMATEANNELRAVKARITRLKELKGGFVAPAKQIIANAEALFDPAISANVEAEKYLKDALLGFQQQQQRLADEARRAREAEERRLRQEAEAKAAAERARAEEQAREARRKAEEAEQARRRAEAEGNARAAAAAAAEAARQTERAQAVIENGEAKAQEAQLAASAAPVMEAPKATELAGFSMRDNWTAELIAGVGEAEAFRGLVAAISGVPAEKFARPDLLPLGALDMKAANKLAKALKKSMNVPLMVAVNRPVAASRAA